MPPEGGEPDGRGSASGAAAKQRLPEKILNHGRQGPAGLGRDPLGLPEERLVEAERGSHTSKHIY